MSWMIPTLFGAAFGLALERSELTRQERVVGVFRLRDFTMMKFLLAALTSGAFVVQAALSLGLARSVPIPPTVPVANLLGGVLFGAAMATAGFCSGTVFAAVGSGRAGLIGGVGGLLAGAVAMDAGGNEIASRLRQLGPRLDGSLPQVTGIDGWLVVLALAAVTVFAAYVFERDRAPVRLAQRWQKRRG